MKTRLGTVLVGLFAVLASTKANASFEMKLKTNDGRTGLITCQTSEGQSSILRISGRPDFRLSSEDCESTAKAISKGTFTLQRFAYDPSPIQIKRDSTATIVVTSQKQEASPFQNRLRTTRRVFTNSDLNRYKAIREANEQKAASETEVGLLQYRTADGIERSAGTYSQTARSKGRTYRLSDYARSEDVRSRVLEFGGSVDESNSSSNSIIMRGQTYKLPAAAN